jgi:hypothetical protein
VNEPRNIKYRVSPLYLDLGMGETTRLAQFKHNIAVGSSVATSGTMQSLQNRRLHRWHVRM